MSIHTPNGSQQQGLPIDFLAKGTDVNCDHCGNYTFNQVFLIKHFSKLVTPNGEEGLLPIPTYACAVCNQINEKLVPPAFRGTPNSKITEAAPSAKTTLGIVK